MKNLMKHIFLLSLFAIAFTACKKDENKTVFEEGTAPSATSSLSGSVTLVKASKDLPFITFTWTNPNYSFNTGVSSQDVSYAVQLDTTGTTGSSKFITFAITKVDLTKTYTHGELNTFLIKSKGEGGLGLEPLVAHDVRIRIKSYLGTESDTNPTNLYSDTMALNVTPYSVDPDLWITGDATPSGWTNTPPATQKFTYDRPSNSFNLTIALPATGTLEGYKFLTISGAWQPQWGGAPATGGTISENPGGGSDPAAIKAPAVAGNYKLTVSLANKTFAIVKL